MYYQNNFSNSNPHFEACGLSTTHTLNVNANNVYGNVCFPLPPPPILNNAEGNGIHSVPPPPINHSQMYPTHSATELVQIGAPDSSLQQYVSLPPLSNLISRRNSIEKPNSLPFSNLNVTFIKQDLMKCSFMMKEFERHLNLLKVFKRTLSNEDWSSRCNEIKCKEKEIAELLGKYENPEYFSSVKRVVKRCVNKRLYRKRKKKEWQEMKRVNKTIQEREHRRIDMWLEKMKDQVEKIRRQEQVKGEADLVLSEVTAKKTEAKRFINLFNTLTKLRNARVQQATSTGKNVSESETKSFTQVIDKLKKLWLDQLKEYNMEEEGLRVMLNDAQLERDNVETKVTRQIQKKWNDLLFGVNTSRESVFPKTLDELIALRYEWDRFVIADNMCLSTKIPVGWIVPSEPSNSDWSRFLQK